MPTIALHNASSAWGRGCVKTSLRMGDKKIDLTESRMRDDHRPAKGLRYPVFDAVIMFLEFLHNLIWTPPVCQVDFSVMP